MAREKGGHNADIAIRERQIAEIDDAIEGELNLYKEYYPENGAFMKALEDADKCIELK